MTVLDPEQCSIKMLSPGCTNDGGMRFGGGWDILWRLPVDMYGPVAVRSQCVGGMLLAAWHSGVINMS